MFKKGQKVVCIDSFSLLATNYPIIGNQYTVDRYDNSGDFIILCEIPGYEWYPSRFIPLLTPDDVKKGDKLKVEYVPEVGEYWPNTTVVYSVSISEKIKKGSIITMDVFGGPSLSTIFDRGFCWNIPLIYLSLVKSDSKEEDKTITIPRSEFSKVYNMLCSDWQKQVNILLSKDLLSDNIEVSKTLIKKAYNEAHTSKHEADILLWLNEFAPKPKQLVKKSLTRYMNIYEGEIRSNDLNQRKALYDTKEECEKFIGETVVHRGVKVTLEYEVEE